MNMLKTIDVIKEVGEEYAPMLRQINIPDFYKCIAQFANLDIQKVADSAMLYYLKLWCKTKKKFFDFMGGQVRVDIPFEYFDENKDFESCLVEFSKDYPGFYFWLSELGQRVKGNKLEDDYYGYELEEARKTCFPSLSSYSGLTLTHFFKKYLKAPDDLVTKVGGIFENNQISATFTISIDPVDMMLASENPYNWTSCYRLENEFESSHADGCLAAIIDDSSLITYVWNNEGKFNLYDNYVFKNVRYKRMRMWISADSDCKTIHFNDLYPNKRDHSSALVKSVRNVVETFFANRLQVENVWVRHDSIDISREYEYGYDEFYNENVWSLKGVNTHKMTPYNNPIVCPCGCGNILPGSDGYSEYNGIGHIYENYDEDNYDYEDDDKE